MTASTDTVSDSHEFEPVLAERRDMASARTSGLRARLAELGVAARDAIRSGRFDDAEAAAAERASLQVDLQAAQEHDAALTEIAEEVARERQRRDFQGRLAEVEQLKSAELAGCGDAIGRIGAAIEELRAALAAGRAHEEALVGACIEERGLRNVLAGVTEHSRYAPPAPHPVADFVQAKQLFFNELTRLPRR